MKPSEVKGERPAAGTVNTVPQISGAKVRTATVMLIVVLAQWQAGCGGRVEGPTGPTPITPSAASPPAPTPPAPPATLEGDRWNLTMTFVSVTGPDACLADTRAITWGRHLAIGHAGDFLLAIQRSDRSILLSFYDFGFYDAPYEQYAGVLAAVDFSATSAVQTGTITCNGERYEHKSTGQLSGRFSPDGQSLSADEVYEVQLSSAEPLRFRYRWVATRQ
jgi:hypothetical protein